MLWKGYFNPLLSRCQVTKQQMMHKQGLHTNRTETIVNNINHNMDLDLITFVLTIIQIIFITLGMVLKSMIIYFEQFGRDTQKRSLFNRVS